MAILPFFFKRKETAITDFKAILSGLPQSADEVDPEMLRNVLVFIRQNLELSPDESIGVENMLEELAANEK